MLSTMLMSVFSPVLNSKYPQQCTFGSGVGFDRDSFMGMVAAGGLSTGVVACRGQREYRQQVSITVYIEFKIQLGTNSFRSNFQTRQSFPEW